MGVYRYSTRKEEEHVKFIYQEAYYSISYLPATQELGNYLESEDQRKFSAKPSGCCQITVLIQVLKHLPLAQARHQMD